MLVIALCEAVLGLVLLAAAPFLDGAWIIGGVGLLSLLLALPTFRYWWRFVAPLADARLAQEARRPH